MDFLYPNTCCFCGKVSRKSLCEKCEKEIIYVEEPRCKRCGKPIRTKEAEYCLDCEARVFAYEQGKSVWVHSGKVRWSIYQFKYHNRRIYGKYYAKEMLRLYADKIREWKIEMIVPVPLHRKRKRQRGYNQSEILARIISKNLGVPLGNHVVIRKKNTKPQKSLQHDDRRKNMKDAFQVVRLDKGIRNILVIDDIYTTGNTIHEVAKCLRDAGAQKVFFLTISIGQGN